MQKLILITILISSIVFGAHKVYADDDVEPITLKEIPENDPTKLNAPSRLRISAYVENDDVVVASTVSTMAQIEIYDSATGKCLFDRIVALAPDYRCTITDRGSLMTIYITVNGRTYEGSFFL